ncbi:protein FLX-like 1 [Dendrobium catenatum]|uniref:Uncharacterized protein n=1 Tax=Dendrobium catenatum TaxID=906689 RepID=A0A2I0VCH8_9ASPA|nr:protein FLX-like 1 [Dendrobium catenatum]PKU61115.1 hypothetical protein MA16_Dca027038 [Dendrobium catenatum]
MSVTSNAARNGLNDTLPPIHSPSSPLVHGLAQLTATHHRHPVIIDGMRDGPPPFNDGFRESRLLLPALIEEQLADQYHEIQGLLLDNQGLTATHVTLEQELAAVHHELHRVSHAAGSMQAERDAEFREVYDNSMKMNAELSAADAMRAELMHVQGEIEKLNVERKDLTAKVQMLTQDMERASAELQRALAIKAEIEAMKQEVQRTRDAIKYEKKEYADNYEQG